MLIKFTHQNTTNNRSYIVKFRIETMP